MDRNIRAFLAIAQDGNLSRAAERIALTQPSLTKRLANLEQDLGQPLFERHRRGMTLTTAGQLLFARASRIEQEYLQAREEIRSLSDMGLDTLRVGAGPTFHLRYVAPLFARLRNRFPDLRFSLIADTNDATLPRLLNGEIDLVLGMIEPMAPDALITTIPLIEIEQSVAMAANDPLADQSTLTPGDLGNADWVAYKDAEDNIPLLRRYFAEQGLGAPRIVARSTSFAAALDLTRALGAKMMCPLQLAPNVRAAGLITVPTTPPISRFPAGVYLRQSALKLPVIRQALDDLRDLAT